MTTASLFVLTASLSLLLCTIAYLMLGRLDCMAAQVAADSTAAGIVCFIAAYSGVLASVMLVCIGFTHFARARHKLPVTRRRP